MPFVDRVKTTLNCRPLRSFLLSLVNQLAKGQGNGVQRISYDDGVWIHQTADGYFAYHQPFVRLNLQRLDLLARTNFFWGYEPKPGDVIVDVGAGVGEETLTFSRAVGAQGRVVCLEAHPRTYRCLEKLVDYNRLTNVIALHRAVTEPARAEALIEDSQQYLGNRSDTSKGIRVAATTLDAVTRQLELGRIHFLKMNIEGAERLAIQGMAETLQCTEVLCICCHDFLADASGDTTLRTRELIRRSLGQSGMQVVSRSGEALPPYLCDQLWGYNRALMPKPDRCA